MGADASGKPKIDPATNPRLAKALADLSADLLPGEDPLYIDFRARRRQEEGSAGERREDGRAGDVEGARAYVAPTAVPAGPVPTPPAAPKVEIAPGVDSRWAETQPSVRHASAGGESGSGSGAEQQALSPWAAADEKIDPKLLPSSYATHAPAAPPPSTKPVGSDKPAADKRAAPGRGIVLAGGALLALALGAALSWMVASPGPTKPDAPAATPPVQTAAPAPVVPPATGPTEAPTAAAPTSAPVPEVPTTNADAGASAWQGPGAHATPAPPPRPSPPALQPRPVRKDPALKPDSTAPPQPASSQHAPPPEKPFILD